MSTPSWLPGPSSAPAAASHRTPVPRAIRWPDLRLGLRTAALVGTLIDNRPRFVGRPGERGGEPAIAGLPHGDLPFRLVRRTHRHVGNQLMASCMPAEGNAVPAADRGPWHGSYPPARDSRDDELGRGGAARRGDPGGHLQGKEPPVPAERAIVGSAWPGQ